MRFLRRCQRIIALAVRDPLLLPEALVLPLIVRLAFRASGVAKTQAGLRKWTDLTLGRKDAQPAGIVAAALLAQRAIRRSTGIGGTCLVRSLALWAILLRRGVASDLRIGMRRMGDKLEGHAWLEVDGVPLNEKPGIIETYSVYDSPICFDRISGLN